MPKACAAVNRVSCKHLRVGGTDVKPLGIGSQAGASDAIHPLMPSSPHGQENYDDDASGDKAEMMMQNDDNDASGDKAGAVLALRESEMKDCVGVNKTSPS
eukprot:scaffold95307_cov17-Tisochrysis_lutea.AAC.1